jgi:hypothetical protein
MSSLYFKATPETYCQIQPSVDDTFRVDWIEAGKCEHILPPAEEILIRDDGFCYLAVPEWMLNEVEADAFRSWPGVQEISEADFLAATAEGANK